MNAIETVDDNVRISDPLIQKQKEDVARMRASLLSCSTDPSNATTAMKNITVLRVYHQVSRIIKYLEMMDKIEEKLYESIDASLDRMDSASPTTWMTLLNIQEKLQKNMLESHKLLQPYLNIEEFKIVDVVDKSQSDPQDQILDKASRDKLRMSAQLVLDAIDSGDAV